MKKQNVVRALLMFALLIGVLVAAGSEVDAQSGGMIGSGTRSQVLGSGGDDGQTMGSGGRQMMGSGGRSNGGMLGSGTFIGEDGGTISGEDDGGGTIGSGTRSQIIGSGARTSSFFDTLMRFFGF
jgi:hypothetical protein